MLRRFSGIVVLMLAASSAALAQFDYTPGFQPGAPEEVIVFEPMIGEWVVDLFYPAPDDTADAGWRWSAWASSASSIVPILGGAVFEERFDGFPISADAVGAEGLDAWSYRTWYSYDRFGETYRAVVVDNLWGLADIYEGIANADGASLSNLGTQTFNTLGERGSRQKVQIRISDMSREGFVVEWWFLDAPNRRMDTGPDEQPWQPSIRMVYSRRGGGTDP